MMGLHTDYRGKRDRFATGSLTVGVDIGGTNLRAAVVDADGQILDIEKLPTPSNVYALETALVHAIGCLQRRNEGIAAVGLAVGEKVGTAEGVVVGVEVGVFVIARHSCAVCG